MKSVYFKIKGLTQEQLKEMFDIMLEGGGVLGEEWYCASVYDSYYGIDEDEFTVFYDDPCYYVGGIEVEPTPEALRKSLGLVPVKVKPKLTELKAGYTYRLIDAEGYFNSYCLNNLIYETLFVDECITLTMVSSLGEDIAFEQPVIAASEIKYFELVEEDEMKQKEFTLSDLVAGEHIVTTRDRVSYLYTGTTLSNLSGFMWVKDYTENMTIRDGQPRYDVVEVRKRNKGGSLTTILEDKNFSDVVWIREMKEQTEYDKLIQQIEDLKAQAEKLKP